MSENRVASFYGDGSSTDITVAPDKPISVLAPPGLVSIVIPCCGMLEYTKLCVPSLLRYTRQPYQLIFMDIGSLDGTAEYLAGVKAAASIRVEIVRTETDLGISDAVQEVLKSTLGEYLVLLNNDTVVSHGWLNQMVALASMSAAVGLVGPMSNYAAPPQLVETVPYRFGPKRRDARKGLVAWDESLVDTEEIHRFALDLRDKNKGKWMETDRLGGFCLLVKREVLDKIGSLEKWTDLSLFDTDILSSKARQAGYILGCCRDLFVHHFGTRTFAHGAPSSSTKAEKSQE